VVNPPARDATADITYGGVRRNLNTSFARPIGARPSTHATFGATGSGAAIDHSNSESLKRVLVAGDAIALFSGFAVPVVVMAGRQADSFWYGLIAAVVIATIGLWAVHFQGLWLDRVLSVRAIEVSRLGMGNLWRAEYLDAGAVVGAIEADAVILCSADIDSALARSLTRSEHQRQRPVYVNPGLSSFDIRRFRATHVAHQPLPEVESMSLPRFQQGIKRLCDIIASGLMLLLAAPILLVIAAIIKAEDRGPVLFRQERVGYRGRTFGILKFRTMVTDAEQLLARLENGNERTGPLFKMEVDPRVTRVGRFLRATTLDELPQLLNLLQGTMSLVGPRPALPKEVNDFDDVLRTRDQARPGITGLWQVEARDKSGICGVSPPRPLLRRELVTCTRHDHFARDPRPGNLPPHHPVGLQGNCFSAGIARRRRHSNLRTGLRGGCALHQPLTTSAPAREHR
jgi:lipopolysaccharide/colanic/teichoic acid biosynthesis glycosyltransferase